MPFDTHSTIAPPDKNQQNEDMITQQRHSKANAGAAGNGDSSYIVIHVYLLHLGAVLAQVNADTGEGV